MDFIFVSAQMVTKRLYHVSSSPFFLLFTHTSVFVSTFGHMRHSAISRSCIHSVSAQCVFQSVRLSRLDVCNMAMVDYPVQSLSKALLTSRLTVLHLHNAQLSGMPLYTLGMTYTDTHTHFESHDNLICCCEVCAQTHMWNCVCAGGCVRVASRTRF